MCGMTSPLNIAIYGGGWIHNMGNAFIQIGSTHTVRQVLPESTVHLIDGNPLQLPSSYAQVAMNKIGNVPLLRFLKAKGEKREAAAKALQAKVSTLGQIDVVVLSGVWLTARYLRDHMSDFMRLKEKGARIVFNGGGGSHYHEREFAEVTELLNEIEPFAIITRDDRAYEAYKDRFPRVHSGMDVGFFVADAFPNPLPMSPKPTVHCFDRGPSPLAVTDDVIVTHHIQAAWKYDAFRRGRVFWSEFATDYLHLYAGADTVSSDRVHACVAALAYGNKAHLIDETPRAHLFAVVGADGIRQGPVALSPDVLHAKKQRHLAALRSVFEDMAKAS